MSELAYCRDNEGTEMTDSGTWRGWEQIRRERGKQCGDWTGTGINVWVRGGDGDRKLSSRHSLVRTNSAAIIISTSLFLVELFNSAVCLEAKCTLCSSSLNTKSIA